MIEFIHIALIVISTGIFFLLIFFFCYHPKPRQPASGNNPSGIHHIPSNNKTLFKWSDNPSLVTDAIESGWSQFAFTDYISSSSTRSNRFQLGSCVGGDVNAGDYDEVEISWDVCQGSADFMQKIRLNSGLKKFVKTTSLLMTAASVIKSALPLPGPTLGNSSPFPQEAYFEITILSSYENENRKLNTGEGENIKLIQENGVNGKDVHVNFEELRGRNGSKDIVEGGNEVVIMLSVGLTGGGSLPVKLPGSYPGSVGFNSDGSIYLDGMLYFIFFFTYSRQKFHYS